MVVTSTRDESERSWVVDGARRFCAGQDDREPLQHGLIEQISDWGYVELPFALGCHVNFSPNA